MADSRTAYSVDEVRERTSIAEVVAPHVRLRKAGKRLVGLCPFHPDQAPSFTLDPEKGLWHCFGCGAGGNVFHFLMRAENLTFVEAARKLAERLGGQLKGARDSERALQARDLLQQINAHAAHFFRRQLADCLRAREYLAQRGLSPELIARFGIGWAPGEWDNLHRHLRGLGFADADIEKSGLCIRRPSRDGCYDRFRARIMFPILDAQERVIGFGGRILEGEGGAAVSPAGEPAGGTPGPPAKYINTPETAVFRKGSTLYAFPLARKAMGERERALVVEGYFDAIACHAAGFTETVATMGTALTQEHLELLRRHTGRVYAAFDADSAGMKAMLRSHELFEAARLEVRVVRLPQGEDPDSFLAARGAQGLQQELGQALTAVEYRLALIAASHPDTEDGRLAMIQEAVEVLGRMRDGVAMLEYANRLAKRIGGGDAARVQSLEQGLRWELRNRALRERGSRSPTHGPSAHASHLVERHVLAAMLQSEVMARRVAAELSPDHFDHHLHRRLFESLRGTIEVLAGLDIEVVLAQEQQPEICALLSELALGYEGAGESDAELRKAVERLCEWRDIRRCKELLAKADRGEISEDELLELAQVRHRRSQVTERRSLGELAR